MGPTLLGRSSGVHYSSKRGGTRLDKARELPFSLLLWFCCLYAWEAMPLLTNLDQTWLTWLIGKAIQWKLKVPCNLKFLLKGLNFNPQWTCCLTLYWVMFELICHFPGEDEVSGKTAKCWLCCLSFFHLWKLIKFYARNCCICSSDLLYSTLHWIFEDKD